VTSIVTLFSFAFSSPGYFNWEIFLLSSSSVTNFALINSEVKIEYNNFIFLGKAKLVTDEELSEKISQLKYPGEEKAKEKRVTIEVTLNST
jgi:hypothetical protein